MNLPDSNFLSGPLWLVTSLHILTLSLHFVAMNFVVGGILIVLTGKSERKWENTTVRRFIGLFPVAMALTVTLGVAPLLFLQLVYPQQVYSAAIVSAWFWLLIIPAVILAYYLLYASSFAGKKQTGSQRRFLLPALLGLLYVSLVYSSVFAMAEKSDLVHRLYARGQQGWIWNPEVGDYMLRWLHTILGAITGGGFFAGLVGKNDPEFFPAAKRMFTYGMAAASIAGLAYLLFPGDQLRAFMQTPGIWVLTAGIALSAGGLHFFYRHSFMLSGLTLFISIVTMVWSRHELRLLRLQGQFDPSSWRVSTQWSPLLLFVVCFVIALALVAYMLRLYVRSERAAG
jgi:hypothetical protein